MMHTMNLDKYRDKLRRRVWLIRMMWLVYLLLVAATHLAGEAVTEHPAFAGLMGASAGGLLVAMAGLSRFSRALKDDTALRRLYNQEHDERKQAIRARAGFPVVVWLGCGMMAAGLIATFFSMTVALTLVIAAVAQLLVSLAIKAWCTRTM